MGIALSFDDLLERLPEGNFTGHGSRAFRISQPHETFIPPNLDILDSSPAPLITLISARGATGKSRLAEQVSAVKQVPLWLLDQDMAVSGDALRARLCDYTTATDGLHRLTESPTSFILIDALDEARMRVSGASWYEYIQTLFAASEKRHSLVLFGRERVLEDVWANFPGNSANWFEISHFDADQRATYIDLYVGEAQSKESDTYIEARDTVLKALSGAVEGNQADSFIGYAPVLYAVALLLEGNLLKIRNSFLPEVGNERRITVLGDIIEQLLKREQEKTRKLAQQLGLAPSRAYTPGEQIDWLAHHLLNSKAPDLSWCPDPLKAEYRNKIREFIDDHPFRSENRWANPVFSAYVAAERFDRIEIREDLQPVGLATGLLFEFISAKEDELVVDEWQFAALHASLMASERHNVEVSVSISGGEPSAASDPLGDTLHMEGELTLWENSGSRNSIRVDVVLDKEGTVDLKGPLASLSLTFPGLVTVNPSSGSANFGPDCFIRCRDLRVSGDSVQVSLRPNVMGSDDLQDGSTSVTFELTGGLLCNAQLAGNPPVDSFEVSIPPGRQIGYPWYPYQKTMELPSAEPNERAIRFVKMLMNLLRNHGHKGTPAVFDKKLEGRQSIKGGEFKRVISALQKAGVVSLDGPMIHLTSEWVPHRFSGKKREGATTFEDKRDVWMPIVDAVTEAMGR
ncbi:hypothetical protein [Streptomyces sp. NPDC047972]|uniref:hypothetical protein n=1 Tax=Streptomyces sp. NPDC047972 TaxID=3365493 RepID=UPI0037107226